MAGLFQQIFVFESQVTTPSNLCRVNLSALLGSQKFLSHFAKPDICNWGKIWKQERRNLFLFPVSEKLSKQRDKKNSFAGSFSLCFTNHSERADGSLNG